MKQKKFALGLSILLLGCMIAPGEGAGQAGKAAKKSNPHSGKSGPSSSGEWNSDLTNMMDQIETQMPGAPKTSSQSQPPQSTKPVQPETVPPSAEPSAAPFGTADSTRSSAEPSETIDGATTGNTPKRGDPTSSTAVSASMKDYFAEIAKSGITRWNSAKRPLRVFIQQSSTAKGFRPEFAAILEAAFKQWANSTPIARITFSWVSDPLESDVACSWTDNKNDMMNSQEGGITLLVPETTGIKRADMKILTVPPKEFASAIPSNYMKRVALHEAGHALGLSGHSPKPDDIMFGTIYPKDEDCHLSERDKATMAALYTQSDAAIAEKRIDALRATSQFGAAATPKAKALELSNQAAKALSSNQLDVALQNLEEAHKLDPTNTLIGSNLGAVYANLGSVAGMTFNFPRATTLFKKAIPLLERGPDKTALTQVLSNYLQILRATRSNPAEQKIIEAKLARLQSH